MNQILTGIRFLKESNFLLNQRHPIKGKLVSQPWNVNCSNTCLISFAPYFLQPVLLSSPSQTQCVPYSFGGFCSRGLNLHTLPALSDCSHRLSYHLHEAKNLNYFKDLLYLIMYISVCGYVYRVQVSKEVGSPGGCELLDVGARNLTRILWQNSTPNY